MDRAKIFTNGRSQAVRLPKEYRFNCDEVFIKHMGQAVILIPKEKPMEDFIASLDMFSDDFMTERIQPALEDREEF